MRPKPCSNAGRITSARYWTDGSGMGSNTAKCDACFTYPTNICIKLVILQRLYEIGSGHVRSCPHHRTAERTAGYSGAAREARHQLHGSRRTSGPEPCAKGPRSEEHTSELQSHSD